jgi:hypothetical protein
MGADEAVWADVRRAHELSDEAAAAFCRRLGVSRSAYYSRRKREGWGPRVCEGASVESKEKQASLGRLPGGARLNQKQAAASATQAKPRKVSRRQLTKRLYAAIEQELEQLESQVARGAVDSVSVIERRSRTLMTMIRSLEKVLELDADKSKRPRQAAKRDERQARDNIDQLRQEIAQRLERLHAEWEHTTAPRRAGSKDD